MLFSFTLVIGMNDKRFYKTVAWQTTRDAYARSVGGLCEECLKRGLYVPGVIVHHKTHLTESNVSDPQVSLSFDNLELLCRDCHGKVHRPDRRYKVDRQTGRIVAL